MVEPCQRFVYGEFTPPFICRKCGRPSSEHRNGNGFTPEQQKAIDAAANDAIRAHDMHMYYPGNDPDPSEDYRVSEGDDQSEIKGY